MSLLTSSIDLDTITPPTVKVSQFPDSHIQNLANLFLKAGDTVSPILLRKISPIAFEILEGHFEYYAAMKAQEIDEQFTAIRAYVVPNNLESTILEQYRFLRSLSVPVAAPVTENLAQNLDLVQMEQAIANRLEQTLSARIDRIFEERISASLQVFTNQITQQLSSQLLDFKLDLKQSLSFVPINQVLESPTQPKIVVPASELEKPVKSKSAKATTTKSKTVSSKAKINSINNDDPKVVQVLNDLNTMNYEDLQRNLAKSAKSNTKFAKLINELRLQQPDQKLRSIQDVIANVAGLAEKTMQKIIDAW